MTQIQCQPQAYILGKCRCGRTAQPGYDHCAECLSSRMPAMEARVFKRRRVMSCPPEPAPKLKSRGVRGAVMNAIEARPDGISTAAIREALTDYNPVAVSDAIRKLKKRGRIVKVGEDHSRRQVLRIAEIMTQEPLSRKLIMGTPKGTKPWNYGKGKGWVDKRGYRWLYVNEDGRRRARRAHRVAMEQHIGRRLEPWEIVHHKDGNPGNNEISNLEIMEFGAHTTNHHKGLRRDLDTRRSMEAFALLREELRHERRVRADLLEALEACAEWFDEYAAIHEAKGPEHAHKAARNAERAEACRAAIAKARGQ